MIKGKFITLEGTEGAGKSTALKFIENYLLSRPIPLCMTREPGGSPFAEKIRHLLLHTEIEETVQAQTELLLMFAARAQHIATCILPALEQGTWVVSDRYVDASYAYQGGGRSIAEADILQLDQMIVKNNYPDLTLLLNVPVELGIQRAMQRGEHKDRIEQENIDFFLRVQQAYLARAANDPKRIKIIDASKTLAEVDHQIQLVLDQFIAGI